MFAPSPHNGSLAPIGINPEQKSHFQGQIGSKERRISHKNYFIITWVSFNTMTFSPIYCNCKMIQYLDFRGEFAQGKLKEEGL